MIEFDELDQRMVLKLVYYGPALSGKTTNLPTNLLQLHDLPTYVARHGIMSLFY